MSYDLFRGYISTKDKKAIMPFKNVPDDKLLTLEQAETLPEYAGILNTYTILIDIDDFEQSEKLLDIVEQNELLCKVYETTRGKHFLFKVTEPIRCATHTRLACGIEADIKVGSKASYSVLKFNGENRKILYDIFEDEDYQELPKYLFPVKTDIDFAELGEGDGRNQTLFNYILTLQSSGFSVEEARECIKLINKYVLKSPLDESEIETILRDEAFQKPVFFEKKKFLFDKFAQYMKSNFHIRKINNQLHIYRDGQYISSTDYIENEMIKCIPDLNNNQRKEVLSYLNILICDNTPHSDARYIAFKNGIYDVVTDSFSEFSPDYVILNKINYDYNPSAYSELCDKTLNKISCNDETIRMLLEEALGMCFYRKAELRKAFVLVGDKRNGKSTYLDMIKTLLGEENTTSIDIADLEDRFRPAELFGKLANIIDDISDNFVKNPAVFKKVISGDRITVEYKNKNPFSFNNYSKFLCSANDIPRIKDKTGAVLDRLIIIPFEATFSPDDPDFDPYIKYKLQVPEVMEYLIQLGIAGLKRVLKNKKFSTSEKLQNQLKEYSENNNPVLLFFKEIDEESILNNPTKDVYLKYCEFCNLNNYQPLSHIEFSKQAKSQFQVEIVTKKVQGKNYRIFVKE